MKELKLLPNQITLIRLILFPILWVVAILRFSKTFAILYAIAGLTDALDGFFARRLKQETKFGSWFDSFADNLIGVSLIFWVLLLLPEIFTQHLVPMLIVFTLYVATMLLGFIKYKRMISYHLISNKVGSVLLYVLLVHALLFDLNITLFYITLLVNAYGLIEEIILTSTHKKMPLHKTSMF